jgi:vesicular inhibitory amino acid transporter
MGKRSLGALGERCVLISFGIEMILALVSFFINIGVNINLIQPDLPISTGILIAAVISCFLSWLNLKLAAISSALGLCMTLVTVFAIVYSGWQLDYSSNNMQENIHREIHHEYFESKGLIISLGLIAFCFGGHGI